MRYVRNGTLRFTRAGMMFRLLERTPQRKSCISPSRSWRSQEAGTAPDFDTSSDDTVVTYEALTCGYQGHAAGHLSDFPP